MESRGADETGKAQMIKATINAKEFEKLFKELEGQARNLRPALIKIGGMLEAASDKAFDRQGPGWKPLKPSTKKQRIRLKQVGKIMDRTGTFKGFVSAQILGPNIVAIGSNHDGARAQLLGYPKRNLPARNYMPVGEAEIRKSMFILSKHLLQPV